MNEPKDKPDLQTALEAVDSREAMREVIAPLRREHDSHNDPFDHPDCPFCSGAIT